MKNKNLLLKILTEYLPEAVLRLLMILIFLSCIKVIGGMSGIIFLLMGVLAIMISLADIFVKNENITKKVRIFRFVWFILLGAVFISVNIFFNLGELREILPMRTFTDQHIYQDEDHEARLMPDAYIRELIRYKAVAVPYEIKEYSVYNPIADEDERGAGFVKEYYIENNYTRYFLAYSGKGYTDGDLMDYGEVGKHTFIEKDFEDIGIANDMLRYTFLLNHEDSKETKYFWYSWYYYSFAESKDRFGHVYVNQDSCSEDELVAIWDKRENLYIMGRTYYEREVAG